MLKFINGLLVIAAVGLVMTLIYMGGAGLARQQELTEVLAERWYLLAGFAVVVVAAFLTRGKAKPAYED
ncbi:MAG TPA: hypothetical protein VG839_01760 [Asticcacaulis sp.]|nr:hypothetical protein [Asticcacaulis sp.]